MKITMTADADHRISSGKSQRFTKGKSYDVPQATADKLIERKVATAADAKKEAK